MVRHTPDRDDESEEKARVAGVPPVQFNIQGQDELQVKVGFLGMTLSYTDRREVIRFVDSVDGLEYRVATLANKMVRRDKQTVGFLTGTGRRRGTPSCAFSTPSSWSSTTSWTSGADAEGGLDLSDVDVLIVAGPNQPIPESEQVQLDLFFRRGGKALFLVDTTAADPNRFIALPNPNTLNDFILRYGVFVHENIVIDLESNETLSFTTQVGNVLLQYPFWIKAPTVESKISGNTETVLLPWAASVELVDRPEVREVDRFIHLVETTEFGVLRWQYQDISPQPDISAYGVESEEFGKHLLAVGLTGTATNPAEGESNFRMVVVGDSDWITDSIASRTPENIVLALNWVDWLAQGGVPGQHPVPRWSPRATCCLPPTHTRPPSSTSTSPACRSFWCWWGRCSLCAGASSPRDSTRKGANRSEERAGRLRSPGADRPGHSGRHSAPGRGGRRRRDPVRPAAGAAGRDRPRDHPDHHIRGDPGAQGRCVDHRNATGL